MAILYFDNGESFATGSTRYSYRPATDRDTTNRIILKVGIQGVITQAVMDTGAPYVICSPQIARRAGVDRAAALKSEIMLIRGMRLEGALFRLNVSLVAREGDNLDVDATVFVPDSDYLWGDFPSFIGLSGFLERIRFALDPNTDTFYFGQL